ncbi:MAG: hypothetical protein ABI970_19730 [Chloroflexota bacterium]
MAAAALREGTAALAEAAEPTAMQLCQFGGFSAASRLPFRRIN